MSVTRHEVIEQLEQLARSARLEASTWRLTAAAQATGQGSILTAHPGQTADRLARDVEGFEFAIRALRDGEV